MSIIDYSNPAALTNGQMGHVHVAGWMVMFSGAGIAGVPSNVFSATIARADLGGATVQRGDLSGATLTPGQLAGATLNRQT